jgi:hypothetical protein
MLGEREQRRLIADLQTETPGEQPALLGIQALRKVNAAIASRLRSDDGSNNAGDSHSDSMLGGEADDSELCAIEPASNSGTDEDPACEVPAMPVAQRQGIRAVGFEPVGLGRPSAYHHPKLNPMLTISNDGFEMGAPWGRLENTSGLCLGCACQQGAKAMPSGVAATCVTSDMGRISLSSALSVVRWPPIMR